MSKKTPLTTDIELICHGCSAFDLNIISSNELVPNHKHRVSGLNYNGGGVAANTAVAAAKLGIKVGFSGYISSDIFGQCQFDDMTKENINMALAKRGEAPSPIVVIIAQPNGSSILLQRDKQAPSAPDFIPEELKPKVILLDGTQKEKSMEWLSLAKTTNAITVLDAGYFKQDTLYLAEKVDIVVSSKAFAEQYANTNDLPAMAERVANLCKKFIVTLDKDGLLWNWEGKKGLMKAWSVDCIDGVGAGDAFHGAFCTGLLHGMSFKENLLFSAAAGALCCTGLGSRKALPDMDTLKAFMASSMPPDCADL